METREKIKEILGIDQHEPLAGLVSASAVTYTHDNLISITDELESLVAEREKKAVEAFRDRINVDIEEMRDMTETLLNTAYPLDGEVTILKSEFLDKCLGIMDSLNRYIKGLNKEVPNENLDQHFEIKKLKCSQCKKDISEGGFFIPSSNHAYCSNCQQNELPKEGEE